MNPPISDFIDFIVSEEKTYPNHEQLHPTAASKCLDSLRTFEAVSVIYENASLSNAYTIANAKDAWNIRSRKLFRTKNDIWQLLLGRNASTYTTRLYGSQATKC